MGRGGANPHRQNSSRNRDRESIKGSVTTMMKKSVRRARTHTDTHARTYKHTDTQIRQEGGGGGGRSQTMTVRRAHTHRHTAEALLGMKVVWGSAAGAGRGGAVIGAQRRRRP